MATMEIVEKLCQTKKLNRIRGNVRYAQRDMGDWVKMGCASRLVAATLDFQHSQFDTVSVQCMFAPVFRKVNVRLNQHFCKVIPTNEVDVKLLCLSHWPDAIRYDTSE